MIPAGAPTREAPSKRTPDCMGDTPLHAFSIVRLFPTKFSVSQNQRDRPGTILEDNS
jgi:hypothetical protein